MIIWGIIWGALIGIVLFTFGFDFGELGILGIVPGAFFGWIAGLTLKKSVHSHVQKEIIKALNTLRAEIAAKESQSTTKSASAHEQTPSSEATVRPSTAPRENITAQAPVAPAKVARPPEVVQAAQASDSASSYVLPKKVEPSGSTIFDTFLNSGLGAVKDWLTGGNTIVRVGAIVLFIGLTFLARAAAQAGVFPIEMRLAAIATVAIVLLVIGFRNRIRKPGFSVTLQGIAVAILYLTCFAAFRLYGIMDSQLFVFALMVMVCALSCILALMQNARSLAFIAFAGGFATPILLSTGGGSHVALFSYMLVLDLAIMLIAWKRAWRELNILGFVATFGIAGLWIASKYSSSDYLTTQPFIAIFILVFIATAIFYARKMPTRLGNTVDSTLVFGTPLVGFGLQAVIVNHIAFGSAFSALALGGVYILLAAWLKTKRDTNYRLLFECFIALGIGFITLAVPLALDAEWTSCIWALEGAAAFWVGARQARWMPRAFGVLLQAMALMTYLGGFQDTVSALPLLHPAFIGAALIAISALLIAWWARIPLQHSGSRMADIYADIERVLSTPLFLYGFAMWLWAFFTEFFLRDLPAVKADTYAGNAYAPAMAACAWAATYSASALISSKWAERRNWAVAAWPARMNILALLLMMLVFAAIDVTSASVSILTLPYVIIWPILFVFHYTLMHISEQQLTTQTLPTANHLWTGWLKAQHPLSVWWCVIPVGLALWYLIDRAKLWNSDWASVIGLLSVILALLFLTLWAGAANSEQKQATRRWPLRPHARLYFWWAALPIAGVMLLISLLLAWILPGDAEPLPYLPILNPLELTFVFALVVLLLWRKKIMTASPKPLGSDLVTGRSFWTVWAGIGFIILNTVWLRIAHHFFSVPWNATDLAGSYIVQTGYSILWSVLALSMMVIAHRKHMRTPWLVGAGLITVVVIKLLLVDMSNRGGTERIIAFISVGILMLIVGYFAPLPPRQLPKNDQDKPESPSSDSTISE